MPCYPGTGHPSEKGCSNNVVNVGLPPGSGSATFRKAWADTILPALEAFHPQLIVVSAGFDAHESDPLADVKLQDADFYWVQGQIMEVARRVCQGKVVSVLEGGYDLEAIARSAVECVRAQVEASSAASEPTAAATVEATAAPVGVTEATALTAETELSAAIAGLGLGNDDWNNGSRPASEEEQEGRCLHRAVLEGFERCRDQKLIRSDPTHGMERRFVKLEEGRCNASFKSTYPCPHGLLSRLLVNSLPGATLFVVLFPYRPTRSYLFFLRFILLLSLSVLLHSHSVVF